MGWVKGRPKPVNIPNHPKLITNNNIDSTTTKSKKNKIGGGCVHKLMMRGEVVDVEQIDGGDAWNSKKWVCVRSRGCRSKLHDDEPSNFDDAKSPSD